MKTTVSRRTLLVGTVGVLTPLAGCGGITAETVVDERVTTDSTYTFELESGETATIEINNEEGSATYILITYGIEDVLKEDIKTEDTFIFKPPESGIYTLYVIPTGRSYVRVRIE